MSWGGGRGTGTGVRVCCQTKDKVLNVGLCDVDELAGRIVEWIGIDWDGVVYVGSCGDDIDLVEIGRARWMNRWVTR